MLRRVVRYKKGGISTINKIILIPPVFIMIRQRRILMYFDLLLHF